MPGIFDPGARSTRVIKKQRSSWVCYMLACRREAPTVSLRLRRALFAEKFWSVCAPKSNEKCWTEVIHSHAILVGGIDRNGVKVQSPEALRPPVVWEAFRRGVQSDSAMVVRKLFFRLLTDRFRKYGQRPIIDVSRKREVDTTSRSSYPFTLCCSGSRDHSLKLFVRKLRNSFTYS